jgi:vacuolar protein sorting-associated protein 54
LQQKFSALKNVSPSNWMLETVITEKSLPGANATPGPSTPTRNNTLSANQRLKGLLSGKSSSFDKPMPIPTGAGLPPPIPPSTDKPRSPAPATSTIANNAHDQHHNNSMDRDRSTNESQVSLVLSSSPPIGKPSGLPEGAGFKQVELSSTNARLEEETPPAKDK